MRNIFDCWTPRCDVWKQEKLRQLSIKIIDMTIFYCWAATCFGFHKIYHYSPVKTQKKLTNNGLFLSCIF